MSVSIQRRGYANCHKTIEILEGKIDLVVYNDRGTSFFFYRFDPMDILGIKISKERYIVYPDEVKRFLGFKNKDYDELVNALLQLAIENQMEERDEM